MNTALNTTGINALTIGKSNNLIFLNRYVNIAASNVAIVPTGISITPRILDPVINPIAFVIAQPIVTPKIESGNKIGISVNASPILICTGPNESAGTANDTAA